MKKNFTILAVLLILNLSVFAKGIVVKSPKAGDVLEKGKSYDIIWQSTPGAAAQVKINIFKNSVNKANFVKQLKSSNSGRLNWLIPSSFAPGKYALRIKTVDNKNFGDSGIFKIVEKSNTKPPIDLTKLKDLNSPQTFKPTVMNPNKLPGTVLSDKIPIKTNKKLPEIPYFKIEPDRLNYKGKGKVTLKFSNAEKVVVKDQNGNILYKWNGPVSHNGNETFYYLPVTRKTELRADAENKNGLYYALAWATIKPSIISFKSDFLNSVPGKISYKKIFGLMGTNELIFTGSTIYANTVKLKVRNPRKGINKWGTRMTRNVSNINKEFSFATKEIITVGSVFKLVLIGDEVIESGEIEITD